MATLSGYVGKLDRLADEWTIVLFDHQASRAGGPPAQADALASRDLFDTIHGQIGVRAPEEEKEVELLLHRVAYP